MKTNKDFKYHLKKDVRDDLEFLYVRLSCLLHHDDEGFEHIPFLFILYSQLVDCIRFIFGSGSIIGFKLMEYGKD